MKVVAVFLLVVGLALAAHVEVPRHTEDELKQQYKDYVNMVEEIKERGDAEPEDAKLLIPELVRKYGYPAEEHVVVTEDGYITKVHRIPYGKAGPGTKERKVVFLQHGILSSAADWLIAGPDKGFGYILADKGYDVWLGNARGTRYSRNHTTLTPDCSVKGRECAEFWQFDWHHIALYDLPVQMDFALATAGKEQLFYIGHSQGTTVFYILMGEKPEYNSKIIAQFSLAPIAYMNHMTSPLLKIVALAELGMEILLEIIGMYEFLPNMDFLSGVGNVLCGDQSWLQPLCTNALFAICGFNKDQMNATMLPIIMGHTPAGSSTNQLLHFAQEINSGKFRQWDYGMLGNLDHYGSISPPNYKLAKVTAPVYLHWSNNDWLSHKTDVVKLYEQLGNVQGKFEISDKKFNHIDYLFAIDAKALIYDKVTSLMASYN